MSIQIMQKNVYPSFKGSWKKTENGAPYYKTSEASVIGGIMAVPAAIEFLRNLNNKDLNEKEINLYKKLAEQASAKEETFQKNYAKGVLESLGYNGNMDEFIQSVNKYRNRMKKCAVPFALIASGMTFGCGFLVDRIRNKKAQDVADMVKRRGSKTTLNYYDNAALSDKNHVYYKSNIGSKYGALLGTVCAIASSAMTYNKGTKLSNQIGFIATFALGGWLLGKLADRNTNKSSQRQV